ncbi:MAG TPA: MFS transporter [Solirubrobacteraceae bacterium]|nr:MFS transporter [Solirubrobacteraceae bacterium]
MIEPGVRDDAHRALRLGSLVAFAESLFFAMLSPLLPYYERHYGLSTTQLGFLSSGYMIGIIVAAIPSASLTAWLGPRASVVIGLLIMAAATAGFGLAHAAPLLYLTRGVQGVGSALAWAGAISWVRLLSPPDERSRRVSTVLGAAYIGTAAGPILGALVLALGARTAFLLAVGVELLLIVWAATARIEPPAPEAARSQSAFLAQPRLLRPLASLILGAVLIGVVLVIQPLLAARAGAGNPVLIGGYVVFGLLAGGVAPRVGAVCDRIGGGQVAIIGLAVGAGAVLLLGTVNLLVVVALAATILCVADAFIINALAALLADVASSVEVRHEDSWALTNLGWCLGIALGSTVAGALAGNYAVIATVLGAAAAVGAAALIRDARFARS